MPPAHRLLALACVLSLAAPAGAALAAPAAKDSKTSKSKAARSGSVVLRTTDDAGTCASAPTAKRAPSGASCPTFALHYAAPHPSRAVKGLVVVFHGHGHNGDQYPAQLAEMARTFDVVAVAPQTEQLAAGKPSFKGPFDSVDEEARDAAAAIAWARAKFRTSKTYLFGVSMGGSGLAYFIDAATRPAAGDADATWVQSFKPLPLAGLVDVEGIANLSETWAEATRFDAVAAAEIETETGGTPDEVPAAYRSRSLALLPTASWVATGLPVAAVIHDADDGLVPYNQTFEARAAIAAAGIPVQSWDVLFKDDCSYGNQTTGTATITKQIPGFPTDQTEAALCLAGHANENDPGTPVMKAASQALAKLVGGSTSSSFTVVNGTPPS